MESGLVGAFTTASNLQPTIAPRVAPIMKLAILSESPADEAALQVLVGYVLGEPFATLKTALRARGWPSVEQVLPPIIRHLHFNTDADGLVVVVDSDDSIVHTPEH